MLNGELPLSRDFSVCTYVNLPRVNKIEKLNEKSRVHVKVEPRSTFTFTRGLSYIAAILFTCVCTEKLRDS